MNKVYKYTLSKVKKSSVPLLSCYCAIVLFVLLCHLCHRGICGISGIVPSVLSWHRGYSGIKDIVSLCHKGHSDIKDIMSLCYYVIMLYSNIFDNISEYCLSRRLATPLAGGDEEDGDGKFPAPSSYYYSFYFSWLFFYASSPLKKLRK
jgi:hypothetical protein